MVLPLLVAVALLLAWLLTLGATQVRVIDAAREAARAAARDDSRGTAVALGRRVAPAGSTVRLHTEGDRVVARVSTRVHGVAGLGRFLPGVTLAADAVADREQR